MMAHRIHSETMVPKSEKTMVSRSISEALSLRSLYFLDSKEHGRPCRENRF